MRLFSAKLWSATAALFFGSGLGCVYALTETDFTNTGVVISAPAQFENNESNNNSAVLVQPKGLTIKKEADTSAMSTPTKAGDVINYTISLDNIGLLGLTDVTVSDSIIAASDLTLASGDTNSNLILDATEVWVYSGSYTVSQVDLDTFGGGDGDIDNSVTVETNELLPQVDSVEVAITQAPGISVEKTVDKASISEPTTLNYEIKVTNTGNLTLNGVSVSDTLPDGTSGTLIGPANDVGISDALDVGESWIYSLNFVVSQADIDDGSVLINSVGVTADETGATAQTDDVQTSIVKTPAMLVEKTVDIDDINAPATLTYTITVANTGNVTLNNVQAVDVLPNGGLDALASPTGDAGTLSALDVGEKWIYTTSYAATQLDIDSTADLINSVEFTSDETGTTPIGATATTTVTSEPSMNVAKTVDTAAIGKPETLSYNITVTNTGNVSLSNVTPVDTLPDGTVAALTGPLSDSGLSGLLDVGEVWEYTTQYMVSQSEIDLGEARVNTVTVTSDETAEQIVTDTAKTTLTQSPAFTVIKSVDSASIAAVGTLNYEIKVENTGNVSLDGIVVSDTMPDGTVVVVNGPVTDVGALGLLDVNETWTYLTQYEVSQSDLNAGVALVNSASVSTAQAGTQTDSATTTVSQTPSISVTKTSSSDDFTVAGDLVNYTFTVVNTGNVLLSNIALSDPIVDAGSMSCDLAQPLSLTPGQQTQCTATRTVNNTDVENTQIVNRLLPMMHLNHWSAR